MVSGGLLDGGSDSAPVGSEFAGAARKTKATSEADLSQHSLDARDVQVLVTPFLRASSR